MHLRQGGWAGIRRTTAEGEGAVSSCAAGADEAWRNHSDRHILHALFFLEASFLLHPGGPPPGQQSWTHPGLGGQVGVGQNSSPSFPIPSLRSPSLHLDAQTLAWAVHCGQDTLITRLRMPENLRWGVLDLHTK